MKRVLDVVLAGLLLTMLSPLIGVLAIVVRAYIGSPVLFWQQRPGLQGKPFWLCKFRSMREEYDASGMRVPEADRQTPFGRWLRSTSLDELPELWNVLVGDMSLVGPRPLLLEYLPLYSPGQARRHEVRPGVTGWAQVHGRNTISWSQKFAYDVWYVDNHNLLVDIRILFMTLGAVVRATGVNQSNASTMEPFRGDNSTGIARADNDDQ